MMEFVFEQAPWELALDALNPGDQIEALKLLSLLEEMAPWKRWMRWKKRV